MAQPITKWQAFRHFYSKDNPGRSVQEASVAWEEYKNKHGVVSKTSTKISPQTSPKTSPKKSPGKKSPSRKTQMEMLAPATLTGLPMEVGRIMSQYLPDKSVAYLQSLSKRTKAFTQKELERICEELPTKGEVIGYVKELLTMPTFTVSFLRPSKVSEEDSTNNDEDSEGEVSEKEEDEEDEEDEEEFQYSNLTMTNAKLLFISNEIDTAGVRLRRSSQQVSRDYVGNYITSLPDPLTMYRILQRRKSCKPKQRGEYLGIVMEYVRSVMKPLLEPFLSKADIKRVFESRERTEIRINLLPIMPQPQPNQQNAPEIYDIRQLRNTYILSGYYLHLASKWLRNELVDNAFPQGDAATHEYIIELINSIFHFFENATREGAFGLEFGLESTYPTTSEVLDYIDETIKKKGTRKVAFYFTIATPSIATATIFIKELTISGGIVKELIWYNCTLQFGGTSRPEIKTVTTSGTVALEKWHNNKILPGIVDPQTAYAISKQTGTKQFVPSTIISAVRRIIREFVTSMHVYINNTVNIVEDLIENILRLSYYEKSLLLPLCLLIVRWLGFPLPEIEIQVPIWNPDKISAPLLVVLQTINKNLV